MWAVKVLIFMLCFNVACMAINSNFPAFSQTIPAGVPGQSELEAIRNATESWQPQPVTGSLIGDIVSGFVYFVQLVGGIVYGFPMLLQQCGAPSSLVAGAYALTTVVYVLAIIHLISGRAVED